jgi:hypothetical protein
VSHECGFLIGLFCIMSVSTGQTGNPARARDVLLLMNTHKCADKH